MRKSNRAFNELRPVKIQTHVVDHAEGSALIEFGQTRVLCTASWEGMGPKWLQGTGQGWITAEYGMLPRATHTRVKREKNLTSGRTQEIARLIGRSLRSSVNLKLMGEKQMMLDCDVINADGGTRTAAITGAFVAMSLAFEKLVKVAEVKQFPVINYVAAVSVGTKSGQPLLDLDYDEDSTIHTDMNFVMNPQQQLIEIQGTAEGQAFLKSELDEMYNYACLGCEQLFKVQEQFVGHLLPLKKD